ncbi:DUF2975 domain-containing protein [Hyunsoonleella sp. SJ7]|uniref:DUF2975 domain-containing protein n=1 Tax=Hyunsoonleella aquatilis TaxID=2762758 RepID=A0A923HB95_9FLAO|nr:DUF2975 domain-containing protein [Hyunsoonleella aquatilis]MBC3756793.1 DUF2975 domain-containing protein [Hyunsoonleella aquatilis]
MKKLAYITSSVLFYIIASILLFIFLFSILAFFEYKFEIDVPFVEILGNRGKVNVPIFGLGINIPFNYAIIFMWIAMTYYLIYFYAFKEFLRVFVEKRTFKARSLKRLRFFLKLNILPFFYIIVLCFCFFILGKPVRVYEEFFIIFAHLVVAFLVYLYLDVLKKGKHIQEENDLTI